MEEQKKNMLVEAGIDVDAALDRMMGNEQLLVRFLKKFKDDQNFEYARVSLTEEKYEDAFKACHALKGVCGNLSMMGLYQTVDTIVELLRSGQNAEAVGLLPDMTEKYGKVIEVIDLLG